MPIKRRKTVNEAGSISSNSLSRSKMSLFQPDPANYPSEIVSDRFPKPKLGRAKTGLKSRTSKTKSSPKGSDPSKATKKVCRVAATGPQAKAAKGKDPKT